MTYNNIDKTDELEKEIEMLQVQNAKYRSEITNMNKVISAQRKEIKDMRFKGQKQQRNFHRLKGVKHREWKC